VQAMNHTQWVCLTFMVISVFCFGLFIERVNKEGATDGAILFFQVSAYIGFIIFALGGAVRL
jgi:hypothetical protein